ncbi:putative plant self-incompatibility S1 [Lupinus albus]|uniref:Putative plant self-incompatibility S1 n=1 Tax=Lupinus albus TaxID=3870 RepID=A0A6A4QEM7_LUPAL|nr:putative plant self-incompatibility S1 [Lupinus albus]
MIQRLQLPTNFQKLSHFVAETKYSFKFVANPIFKRSLWYCKFVWTEVFHNFDIYVQTRDEKCENRSCSWIITEQGPCQVTNDPNNPICFQWD